METKPIRQILPRSAVKELYPFEIIENQREEIKSFLRKNLYLVPILKEARGRILSVFGEGTKVFLELHLDPQEDFEELFVVIKSHYDAREAQRRLNLLGHEWFLKILEKTRGKLNITEEPA